MGPDPMIVSCDGQRETDTAASSGSCAMQEIIGRFCEDRGGQGEGGYGEEMHRDGEYVAGLDLRELVPAFR